MNLLYIQSGGPTSVINQTAAGVYEAAKGKFDRIYAAHHALEGLLDEQLIDMRKADLVMKCIGNTPSSAFGTSRMELHGQPDHVIDRIFAVLQAHDITHVITNGGGDTAETALTLYREAQKRGIPLKVAHAPKTIDNDLPRTDHSPGFGTAATDVAHRAIGNYLDAKASRHVKIDIVMGRVAGWLTASALLARDSGIDGPHLIYVGEHNAELATILNDVEKQRTRYGFAHVVLSEAYGQTFAGRDKTELSSGSALEQTLEQAFIKHLNVKIRVEKYGYSQRSSVLAHSPRDSEEAKEVGRKAVEHLLKCGVPTTVLIHRLSNNPYRAHLESFPLDRVATPGQKKESLMPHYYLGPPGVIDDSFLEYVRPLAGKIKKVLSLTPVFVLPKLPIYEPQPQASA